MRSSSTIAVVIFSIIAFGHLLRLLFKWEVIVNGIVIPQWVSVSAFAFLGALAFMLWREARARNQGH